MKIQTKQKYVLLAGMTGFVLGICSANLWMKEYILDIGIFNQFFLEQYNRLEIVYEEYFWYLIKNRGVFLLILTAAAGTRYRKSAVILTVIWLGFCVGMVICTAIARLGIKGIVLCVIAVMPQGVFYILSAVNCLIHKTYSVEIDDSSVMVEVPVTKASEDMGLNKAE